MYRPTLRRAAYATIPIATAGFIWYNRRKISEMVTGKGTYETFQIPVRIAGPDGKPVRTTKTIPLLSDGEVDRRIGEHALGQSVRRPDGIVWKYQTAFIAANDGIEDAHAQALVERDTTPGAPPGDLLFFAVMDGHGGPHTSRLLSKVLIPAVAMQFSSLTSSPPSIPTPNSVSSYLKSFISSPPSFKSDLDADPNLVSEAIKTAFKTLDSQIINAPVNLMNHLPSLKGDTKPYEHPMAGPTMLPASSGSCALLAMLDTARKDMYVACTGDSRAVAGYWDEPSDGSPGSWRAEVLTEDQTGRNPNELKRIQSEHPVNEAATVIRNGRVLGGLEPSRAFGDARYKWPREVQEQVTQTMIAPGTQYRRIPPDYKTPPYVTAEPVISHRKLSFLPLESTTTSASSSPQGSKSTLKFVVLATDGLWDQLTSSEVVSLVGGHMSGLKGPVAKSALASTVAETEGALGVEGKEVEKRRKRDEAWAFQDEHIGTHLIRNAFGGADRQTLNQLVSIPPGVARRFRDDLTVTVIWYENSQGGEEIKSKL